MKRSIYAGIEFTPDVEEFFDRIQTLDDDDLDYMLNTIDAVCGYLENLDAMYLTSLKCSLFEDLHDRVSGVLDGLDTVQTILEEM